MDLVKRLLIAYGRHFPVERGKKRVIEYAARRFKWRESIEAETEFGIKMVLDLSQYVQRQIYFRGVYEKYILELMKSLQKKYNFDLMLDIGANTGQHSLFMAVLDNPPHIISFEPDASTFQCLTKNIFINNLQTHIKPLNVAISDVAGSATMKRPSRDNDGMNYISEEVNGAGPNLVSTVRLDDFCSQKGLDKDYKSVLIKLDAEGAEEKVISGAINYLSAIEDKAIIIEICKAHLERFGSSAISLIRKLESVGLTGFLINNDRLHRIDINNIPDFCEALFIPPRLAVDLFHPLSSPDRGFPGK